MLFINVSRRCALILGLLWISNCLEFPSLSNASERDLGVWTGLMMQGKFSDQFGWYFENQLRAHEGWEYLSGSPENIRTRGNRLLLRAAVRWMPSGQSDVQLWVGWGWTPNLSPERDEHRLWEQVLFQGGNARGGVGWAQRLRLEQRQIELTSGLQHRVRYFGKLTHFASELSVVGLFFWTEIFWNLNGKERGPAQGLDQTRVFVGPVFQAAPNARVELGYLNVFYAKGSARDSLMSHLLGTYVQLDFP